VNNSVFFIDTLKGVVQGGAALTTLPSGHKANDFYRSALQMEDDVQASSLPEVNSRQLRAVLAVAEYRSFIAAAAFLKTSQPALTRTIKQIEAILGASLFSRSTRQVSITEAGKEFASLAERLLNDLKIGIENMRELAEQRRGQIIVASVMSLAHFSLPRVIAEYNRHFQESKSTSARAFRATSRMTFTAAWRILDSDMSRTCRSHSQRRALAQRPFMSCCHCGTGSRAPGKSS
jgi:DNA-binding transcriptional LysR family regulator